jgi:hypothetical protein
LNSAIIGIETELVYWRWRLAQDPFAAYEPASSAIGVARIGQITRSPKFDRSTE